MNVRLQQEEIRRAERRVLGPRGRGEAGPRGPHRPVTLDRSPRRFAGLPTALLCGRRVPVAESLRSRLLGLALLDRERAGAGLLIPRCRAVHTFGMRFRLDVLFLDAHGRVVELRRAVPPRRRLRCAPAAAVLELAAPELDSGGPGGNV